MGRYSYIELNLAVAYIQLKSGFYLPGSVLL